MREAGYELEYLLGRGSGGEVHRARQKSTGQAVALKIFRPTPDDGEHLRERRKERFRREMKICAKLAHPNIVRLIDYGENGDLLFSVFELVRGQTLADKLQVEGALTIKHTMLLMRQLLGALHHAHQNGVIHRDLKPSNLMILEDSEDLRLKVLDFGIGVLPGRFDSSVTRLTLSSEVLGTPAYAAPEQLRGDAPTPKADLYSWGLVFLECLTGRRVVGGSSLGELFQKQLSPVSIELPAPLAEHGLGTLLRWVLEKDAPRRAGFALDVQERLIRLDTTTLANPTGYLLPSGSSSPMERSSIVEPTTLTAVQTQTELRFVIVVCCQLEIQMPHASDPEAIDAYRADLFALAASTIAQFGGRLVGGVGDIATYSFGIPCSKDTDVRMATHATLELAARLRKRSNALNSPDAAGVRMKAGIHCGVVNAGVAGENTSVKHSAVAAVALALATSVEEGTGTTIVVSESFRRRCARHAEFSDAWGEVRLSWQEEPVAAHYLVGELRIDGQGPNAPTLVGRTQELRLLAQHHQAATDSRQLVLVRGDAGVGKSRLVFEHESQARTRGQSSLTLRFLPELQHLALGPMLTLVLHELDLKPGVPPNCESLRLAVEAVGALQSDVTVPLLAGWMSVPLEAPFSVLPHSPQRQRALLLDALVDIVLWVLRRKQCYLTIEDLHWADPSSLDWISRLFERLAEGNGFVLMTARPEFESRWECVATLDLEGLNEQEVGQLAHGLSGGHTLNSEQVGSIVKQAAGNPLYVEELVGALLRDRDLTPPTHAGAQYPATLQGLLASRLDGLGIAKRTAQLASLIGREADLELLLGISDEDDAVVLADLDQLVSANILQRQRGVHDTTFVFRHMLIREAAYSSIPVARRRRLHLAVAEACEAKWELWGHGLSAQHYQQAAEHARAVEQFLAAADRALLTASHQEALELLKRAIDSLDALPESPEKDELELRVVHKCGVSLFGRHGAELPDEGKRLLSRGAQVMEREPANSASLFLLRWTVWGSKHVQPAQDEAQSMSDVLVAQADALGDPVLQIGAQDASGRSAFFRGDYTRAREHFDRALSLYRDELDAPLGLTFATNPIVNCLSFGALARLAQGELVEASAVYDEAISRSRATGAFGTLAGVLATSGAIAVLGALEEGGTTDLSKYEEHLAEGLQRANDHDYPIWGMMAATWQQLIAGLKGDASVVGQLTALLKQICGMLGSSFFIVPAARLAVEQEPALALELLGALEATTASTGERFLASEMARIQGLAHARLGEPAPAGAAFRRALDCARHQDARLFELRAAWDLHQHETAQGSSGEADLERASGWFKKNMDAAPPSVRRAVQAACQ